MNHNIFRFATKELSQDAFLAWSVSWLKDENEFRMKEFAKEFLTELIAKEELWKELLREDKVDVEVEVQFYHIDILVMLYDKIRDKYLAIIIEDKVNTQEHHDQIERYRNLLEESLEKVSKYQGRKEKIEKIVTCYYKPYDECGIETKREKVDCVFTRQEVIALMKKYTDIKQEYFQEYWEYIQAIEECARAYQDESVYSEIIEKRKKDIKAFAFFKKLERIYHMKIDKNELIYFGTATAGNSITWWCNIPIGFKVISNVFNPYAYIKINLYENKNDTIMLKISKKQKLDLNCLTKMQYNEQVFSNQEIYENIKKQLTFTDQVCVKRSRKGRTKTQPEMNILTIDIPKQYDWKAKIKYIEEIIVKLQNDLTGKSLDIRNFEK